ncbi:MAG: tetratricopeptide repeat protein [Polyangiales bacterium]
MLEPYEQLKAWTDERGWERHDVAQLEALDLTAYLRDTAHIRLAPTERLRKLAIALECQLNASEQPRGWLALERIYAAGSMLDPSDAEIEVSRAVTAELCASCVDNRPDVRRRMILAGRAAATRAIELRPSDAGAHYALGMLHYSFQDGSIEVALNCFEAAIAADPSFGWARLYRAHCLHDLGRWSDAAQAYSEVDPSSLVGPRAWRYDLLREQRAWCLLQAGQREQALSEFLGILHRYELQPGLAKYQMLKELTAAAKGPLRVELSERLGDLRRKLDADEDVFSALRRDLDADEKEEE